MLESGQNAGKFVRNGQMPILACSKVKRVKSWIEYGPFKVR